MRNVNRSPQLLCALLAALALPAVASAQDSSLLKRGAIGPTRGPLTLSEGSMLYEKAPPVDILQLHDIVTVVVNINSRMLSEGDAESRKTANLSAVLVDWIRFTGKSLRPDRQSEGDPAVTGTLNSQYRANSDIETRNTLTFTIAARVVDIRPNGTLLIEARQTLNNNEEVWETSLTGVIRREDVAPDNKVESEDIADLRVVKREIGQVADGYQRGWLGRLYGLFHPF